MEEEISYSTLVFKNAGAAPKEKKEGNYSEVEPAATGQAATTLPSDGEAAAHSHFHVLVACLGILCVLLVASISAIIYINVVLNDQTVNLSNLTAQNQQLIEERGILERETEELSRVTDNLNWTLGLILRFDIFPVNDYCPDKKCQLCGKNWILFQKKCYLFYDEGPPWQTWQESRKYCQNTAADLAVIDSPQEQEFISAHIKRYYDRYHGYWLGLYENKDKNWVWIDGRNGTRGFWAMKPLGTSGLCALIIPERSVTANWEPADCTMENKFVCESDVLIRDN
ncbi:C-type lectin domain family 4 member A-like [Plectropomus leopardus]|uniref:C-type lectin domain family 4 member A-like n=1 Tax=Plectropomus leopardus TaxID=160734 RepID=UPI001C4B05D1|nr:C-type lectin domain family 4 member A-like [Plectropomus leopardus]